MEPWFMYACLSAIFAGIQSSIQKISIQRGVSTVLVNSYGALVSGVIALLIFIFQGALHQGPWSGFLLVFISGGVYMYGTISRSRSMRFLDTAVVFSSYKSLTLLGTVLAGVLFFTDRLSLGAWVGVVLAVSTPFLLLEVHERHARKKFSLKSHFYHAGWTLLYVSVFAGVLSALMNKVTVNFVGPMILFTSASHLFGGFTGIVQQFRAYPGEWKKQFLDTRHPHSHLLLFSAVAGASQCAAFYFLLIALSLGQVSSVYAINSAYLMFPVLFSLWYYNEHLTFARMLAIAFSVVSVLLLSKIKTPCPHSSTKVITIA